MEQPANVTHAARRTEHGCRVPGKAPKTTGTTESDPAGELAEHQRDAGDGEEDREEHEVVNSGVEEHEETRHHGSLHPASTREEEGVEHEQHRHRHQGEPEDQGVEVRDLGVGDDEVDERGGECCGEVHRDRRERGEHVGHEPRNCAVGRNEDAGDHQDDREGEDLVVAEPGREERVPHPELVAVGEIVEEPPRLVDELAGGIEERDELVADDDGIAGEHRGDPRDDIAKDDEAGDVERQADAATDGPDSARVRAGDRCCGVGVSTAPPPNPGQSPEPWVQGAPRHPKPRPPTCGVGHGRAHRCVSCVMPLAIESNQVFVRSTRVYETSSNTVSMIGRP